MRLLSVAAVLIATLSMAAGSAAWAADTPAELRARLDSANLPALRRAV